VTRGRPTIGAALIVLASLLQGCAVHPQPLTPEQIQERADIDLTDVDAGQEPAEDAIGLYEAMARAIKYNLDLKVEELQSALRVAELDLTSWERVPQLVANSGYAARDNFNAANSVDIVSGLQSLRTSTSQERKINTADIGFSWNVLDFGLSYVHARQAADKSLIQEETRRKVVQRIIEDVRTAYWRAVSSERLMRKLSQLEARTAVALRNTRKQASDRETSPITALTYERELVEVKRTIQELERDLKVATTQLAALMNILPDQPFSLVIPERTDKTPNPGLSVQEMATFAMLNRPELREIAYQRRINEHDADAALLELLPGINLSTNLNYDSNDFLLNNNWAGLGYRATWNLLKVFQYPQKRALIELQDDVLRERELALTMAILTQVHVSNVRYRHMRRELKTASEYLDVQRRLIGQMRSEAKVGQISEQTLIREELNTLVAEVKHDIAFSSLQNGYANLYASLGLDPYANAYDANLSVKDLAAQLKQLWVERGEGRVKVQISSAD
jgi:outer membrane protein TolC